MMKFIIIHLLAICSLHTWAQSKIISFDIDKNRPPREHNLDFTELKLEVNFDMQNGIVKGKLQHLFTPLQANVNSFYLDALDGITISAANLNGKDVEMRRDTAGYTFFLSEALQVSGKYTLNLNYTAKPKRGLYFVGWNDTLKNAKKQIWTQGQGIDNRNWIPMYDEMNDKIISELTINFENGYKVLSNGTKLQEKSNPDNTTTWKYRMTYPHAPYLIMLAIGKYDIKEIRTKSGVPIRLWYYPEHKDRVDVMYKYTTQIMEFMERETGVPYPWKTTYSQVPVQDYMYGAMENTTATVFGDFYSVDARAFIDRSYVATNAHEMAHMWFGDMVTARSAADIWLQESFATHYQWLFDREVYGQDSFDWLRKGAANAALTASQTDKKAVAHSEGGSTRWYPKGAFILEMLKYIVGREQFNKVIKYYLEKNAYKNVDSHELLMAFHEVLGLNLSWFWEQWLYKGGEPHYEVKYRDIRNAKNERVTEITVAQIHEQTPTTGLFKMPVKMEVHYKDNSKDTVMVNIENQYHTITIPNKNNLDISFVLFDPNNQILKTITFNKYQEELINQAIRAPYMIDKYDALLSLRSVDIDKKRETLLSIFIRGKFHALRTEALYQIVNDTAAQSQKVLMSAITDKDVAVRKALVSYIKNIPKDMETEMRKLLADSSYQLIEATLEKLSSKFPENVNEYLEITKNEGGNYHKNVRIKWLEIACDTQKDKFVQELVNYAAPGYEFRTRTLAIEALKRLNYLDNRLLYYLANASSHYNSRLAKPAEDCIQYYFKQNQYKRIMHDAINKGILKGAERASLLKNMK
ncbi:MAG: M1 family metallopeptidase [Cytophagales bacterium]|nr:M1 family metallopeptidase [Cytophagales bacterium]